MTPIAGIVTATIVVAVIVAAFITVHAVRRATDKQAQDRRHLPIARRITVDRTRWTSTERALLDLGADPQEIDGIITAAAVMAQDLASFKGCTLQEAERAISQALTTPFSRHAPASTPPAQSPPVTGPRPEEIADQARRVAAAVAERTVKAITSRARLGRSPLTPTHDPGRGRASWTVKDVAALTRWPERTVYTWAQAGRIPCERSGRRVRFHAGEVKGWWQQFKRERDQKAGQTPEAGETHGGQVDLPFAQEA